jgi:hypothetical protein
LLLLCHRRRRRISCSARSSTSTTPSHRGPITGINLTLSTDVTIDGTDEGILSFQFHFTNDETDNAASPCADGGHVGHGVDVNGCADHVTVNALCDTAQFTIGGDHYTIGIVGFEQNGVVTDGFWTEDGGDQHRRTCRQRQVVQRCRDGSDRPAAPEPSTWAMGLIGFAGLGFWASAGPVSQSQCLSSDSKRNILGGRPHGAGLFDSGRRT